MTAHENEHPGRVALVTGAAHGIGRSIAERLAEQGYRLVISDGDGEAAAAAAAAMPSACAVVAGDLLEERIAAELVDTAIDRFGRLDIVANIAGYSQNAPIEDMTEAMFKEQLEIHLVVPWRILKAAAPHLKAAGTEGAESGTGAAKVVNMSSMAAYGSATQTNYGSAKAGLIGLTKALAREWGASNVCVNAIAPGWINTRRTMAKVEGVDAIIGERRLPIGLVGAAEVAEGVRKQVPLQRLGESSDVAGTAAFLCSPDSDYITGQVFNVGGGLALGMSG